MIDLRCPHRKFGVLMKATVDEGLIEVMCPSRWCGRRDGTVVLHTFSTQTGALMGTRSYRDPKGRR